MHGTGSGDLLDLIVDRLAEIPDAAREEDVTDEIRVAILGRPNVGKSSLVNALVGAPRVIVSEVPGTTRDSIDIRLEREGDDVPPDRHGGPAAAAQAPAGGRVLERAARHRRGARGADVALVLVDSSEGVTDQDLPSPTRRARPAARRSWSSPSGTSTRSTSTTCASASTASCASARRS